MGIIPPKVENGYTEEDCRKIQCIGGCGVSLMYLKFFRFFKIFVK